MKYFKTTPQLSKISKKSQIFLIQAQQTWYFVKFIINKRASSNLLFTQAMSGTRG